MHKVKQSLPSTGPVSPVSTESAGSPAAAWISRFAGDGGLPQENASAVGALAGLRFVIKDNIDVKGLAHHGSLRRVFVRSQPTCQGGATPA